MMFLGVGFYLVGVRGVATDDDERQVFWQQRESLDSQQNVLATLDGADGEDISFRGTRNEEGGRRNEEGGRRNEEGGRRIV
jgi:hypothetical protein